MSYKIDNDNLDYEPEIIDKVASEYYCLNCMALMELDCCCDMDE